MWLIQAPWGAPPLDFQFKKLIAIKLWLRINTGIIRRCLFRVSLTYKNSWKDSTARHGSFARLLLTTIWFKFRRIFFSTTCDGSCSGEIMFNFRCINSEDGEPDLMKRLKDCFLKESTCKDGQEHGRFIKCNGKVDCEDGSDETVESCAGSWL